MLALEPHFLLGGLGMALTLPSKRLEDSTVSDWD